MYEPLPDLGTPAPRTQFVELGKPVNLTIDGRDVTVSEGTSVMRAAALAGIKVPRLCATDSLDAFGSCRVCLVEIEGRKGYPASCTTTVEEGMVVSTQSDHLSMLRRNVVELYVSDHPLEHCSPLPTAVDSFRRGPGVFTAPVTRVTGPISRIVVAGPIRGCQYNGSLA